jgi:molybdate transport repressor ModE-like protein
MAVHEQSSPNGWLGVEMRHLAALEAVGRCGSFSGAADELGYVQSAVSQQIARLERSVGTQLIERQRGHRAIGLTPPGRLLASHARHLVRELQAARLDLAMIGANPRPRTLYAGMAPGIAEWFMPLLARHPRQFGTPRMRFVEVGSASELGELVEAGEVDVGFGYGTVDPAVFEMRRVVDDRLVVVAAAGSTLGRQRETVAHWRVADVCLIAPASGEGLEAVEPELAERGLDLARARRSSTLSELHDFAASGEGLALMPSIAVDEHRGVTAVRFTEPQPRIALYVFWQRHRRQAAALEALADFAIAGVERLAPDDFAMAA